MYVYIYICTCEFHGIFRGGEENVSDTKIIYLYFYYYYYYYYEKNYYIIINIKTVPRQLIIIKLCLINNSSFSIFPYLFGGWRGEEEEK